MQALQDPAVTRQGQGLLGVNLDKAVFRASLKRSKPIDQR